MLTYNLIKDLRAKNHQKQWDLYITICIIHLFYALMCGTEINFGYQYLFNENYYYTVLPIHIQTKISSQGPNKDTFLIIYIWFI